MNCYFLTLILSLMINLVCQAQPDAESLRLRGNQLYKEKNFSEALETYQQALNLQGLSNQDQGLLHRNCGITYAALKKYSQAIEHYLMALKTNHDTNRTYCLLAKAKYFSNRRTEALYYLEKTTHLDCHNFTKKATAKYEAMLKEARPSLHDTDLNLIRQRSYENYFSVAKELALGDMNELNSLTKNYGQTNAYLNFQLEKYWRTRLFSPLNRIEQPRLIAEFLQPNTDSQTIITPIVQTLPYHLAKKYNVISVDVVFGQITFQNEFHGALKNNRFNDFRENAKRNFIAASTDSRPEFLKQTNQAFKNLYGNLAFHSGIDSIRTQNREIFEAVYQMIEDKNPPNVVFLSTIPQLSPSLWYLRYKAIREWLSSGITVSFSIMFDAFASEQFARDMIFGFDDIATRETALFKESPIVMHVKFTPKN